MGFSSKYDFSKSLTFLPAKSAVLMLEKTSSLKKETKLSTEPRIQNSLQLGQLLVCKITVRSYTNYKSAYKF